MTKTWGDFWNLNSILILLSYLADRFYRPTQKGGLNWFCPNVLVLAGDT